MYAYVRKLPQRLPLASKLVKARPQPWEARMDYVIVRHDEEFAMWGVVVDAPLTFGLEQSQLASFVRHFGGEEALAKLPDRINHALQFGSPEFHKLIAANRAGQDGRHLSEEELMRYIFVEKVFPPADAGAER